MVVVRAPSCVVYLYSTGGTPSVLAFASASKSSPRAPRVLSLSQRPMPAACLQRGAAWLKPGRRSHITGRLLIRRYPVKVHTESLVCRCCSLHHHWR